MRFLPLLLLAACAPGSGPAATSPGTPTGTTAGTATGTTTPGPTTDGVDNLDLISDGTWPGLRVRIDYIAGHAPDPDSLQRVEDALDGLLASGHLVKPAGIELVLDEELPARTAGQTYSFAENDALLEAHRGPNEEGDFAVIHALWVDGAYEGDDGGGLTLGYAYGINRFVMLDENVETACDNFLSGPLGLGFDQRLCEATEATVLLHELGHLFGLVNNGLPMQADHQDEANGRHDDNTDCLMYWAVERSTAVEVLAEDAGLGPPTIKQLDQACLDDLMAAQGG